MQCRRKKEKIYLLGSNLVYGIFKLHTYLRSKNQVQEPSHTIPQSYIRSKPIRRKYLQCRRRSLDLFQYNWRKFVFLLFSNLWHIQATYLRSNNQVQEPSHILSKPIRRKYLQCRRRSLDLFQYNWRKFVFLIPRADKSIAGTRE